jgi:Trm5-related predicted tRNA methylase
MIRSTEDMATEQLKRYLAAGFSMEIAIKKVKALRHGHWDMTIELAAKKLANQFPA